MNAHFILTISILIQFWAAYLALRLIPITKKRKSWTLIALAVSLMGFRRLVTLYHALTSPATTPPDLAAELLSLLVTLLLAFGLAAIAPLFRSITQSEKALHDQEEMYTSLIEQASDGIFISDPQGNYVDVNPRGCELLGYSRQELLQLNLRDLLTTEDLASNPIKIEDLRAGKIILSQRRLRHKSGALIPVEISAKMLADGKLQGIVREISERMRIQESIEQERVFFQTVLENAFEGISISDAEGNIQYGTHLFEKNLGYAPAELRQINPLSLIHPDDALHAANALQQLTENPDQVATTKMRFRHKDGSWRVIQSRTANLTANPIIAGFVSNYRDITTQENFELGLQSLKEFNESIIQSMAEGLITIDLEGQITFANPAAIQLFGLPASEVINRHWKTITPQDQHAIIEAADERRARGEADQYELDLLTPQGKRVPIFVSGSPRFEAREFVGTIAIFTNLTERRLAEQREASLGRILEDSLNEIYIFNADTLRFSLVNRGARLNLGYSLDEMHAMTPLDIKPEFSRARFDETLHPLRSGEQYKVRFTTLHQRKDGSRYPVDVHLQLSSLDQRPVFIAIIQDITETVIANEALRKSENLFIQAQKIAGLGSWELDIASGEVYSTQEVYNIFGTNPQQIKMSRQEFFSIVHPDDLEDFTTQVEATLAGRGPWAVEHRIIRPDGATRFIYSEGVLENDTAGNPKNLVGTALDITTRKKAERELQLTNQELLKAYDSTLEGWVRALELRDRETENHTQRVTELTLDLSRYLGIKDSDLVHVRRGALLHDIGKMGIPDHILNKPGPLSDEEERIMRQHPLFAYQLLTPIIFLRPAMDIPYCHHEKWDGAGYPQGLAGKNIPLAARIFAVADVWDALTSNRPYRQAWSSRKAVSYIQRQSGKHFDPQVVDAFKEIISSR